MMIFKQYDIYIVECKSISNYFLTTKRYIKYFLIHKASASPPQFFTLIPMSLYTAYL